jgi:hypothetical protein
LNDASSLLQPSIVLAAVPTCAQEAQPTAKGGRASTATEVQDDEKPAILLPNGVSSIN